MAEINDIVQVSLDEDVHIVGWITAINEEGTHAQVYEAHAFHRMWGGSNAERGMIHTVSLLDLQKCHSSHKQIVKDVRKKYWEENRK